MTRSSLLVLRFSVVRPSQSRRALPPALFLLALTAPLGSSCGDPVQQAQVAALGPEEPGVPPGPLHRAGQPCLLCHAAAGEASRFTAAGTVYSSSTIHKPVGGVKVQLIDAARRTHSAYTNCIGNFFVAPQEYEPVLPMWVSLSGYSATIDMESPMHKDGDCGFCHRPQRSPSSAGPVFLTEDPEKLEQLPKTACSGVQE